MLSLVLTLSAAVVLMPLAGISGAQVTAGVLLTCLVFFNEANFRHHDPGQLRVDWQIMPVLGSRAAQAVEELCEEGRTGWSFDPENATQMATALEQALTVPAARLAAMRQAARGRAKHLTASWAADRLVDSLYAALGNRAAKLHGEH
jgi:hypothetical protein